MIPSTVSALRRCVRCGRPGPVDLKGLVPGVPAGVSGRVAAPDPQRATGPAVYDVPQAATGVLKDSSPKPRVADGRQGQLIDFGRALERMMGQPARPLPGEVELYYREAIGSDVMAIL